MTWRHKALLAAKGPIKAEIALIAAYRDVFGKIDASRELVLVDLATHCRFFLVEERGISGDEANYVNGLRAGFMRILQHLSLSDADIADLVEAARQEAANNEG